MKDWQELEASTVNRRRSKKRIDTLRHCKRNRLGYNKYGPHKFENRECLYCGKPEYKTE